MAVLLALQCCVVLFVGLHNWVPLGTLNNVKGVRLEFPTGKLFLTTLTNFIPATIGLVATICYIRSGHPHWVFLYLWIFYALACFGSFTAWWKPYLLRRDPEKIARYQTMYAANHSFLPLRNGLRPDTLHVLFDLVTIAIMFDLAVLTL